jgi:hypothetical protein
MTIGSITRDQLLVFSGKETPADVRSRLGQIIDLREAADGFMSESNALEEQRTAIFADQERLRNNLSSLGKTKEDQTLRKRYLDQLAAQEDQLVVLRAGITRLADQLANTLKEMAALIDTLTFKPDVRP